VCYTSNLLSSFGGGVYDRGIQVLDWIDVVYYLSVYRSESRCVVHLINNRTRLPSYIDPLKIRQTVSSIRCGWG